MVADNKAGVQFLDRPGRREAALISTFDGKRIISQLSFEYSESRHDSSGIELLCRWGHKSGVGSVQRISCSRVGGRFLSHVWGMRL
jgi:hypothetical protein